MFPRTLALGLAVLLTVSALVVVAPLGSHGSDRTAPLVAASSSPSAAIVPTIYNAYGTPTHTFDIGRYAYDTLTFSVFDPLDHDVNVTITDPNATRDGVASPAFSYEAALNATTYSFDSAVAGVSYTFPTALHYGGGWVVNFSAPNAGIVTVNITLRAYSVGLLSSLGSSATLPGEPFTISWFLLLLSNGYSPYTYATNVWITGWYTGDGTFQNYFPAGRLPLTLGSSGQWSGSVPSNATSDTVIVFEVYAITNSSGQLAENESATINVYVGALTIDYTTVAVAPGCPDTHQFSITPGSPVSVCFVGGADYLGDYSPIAGISVAVSFWNGTAHVTPPLSGSVSLTTNATGVAATSFTASSPPFVTTTQYPYRDAVNFTASWTGGDATGDHYTLWSNVTFQLAGLNTASGVVTVSYDRPTYFEGAVATVTWSVSSTNPTLTGAITPTYWFIIGPDSRLLAQGTLSGTAQSGSFSLTITSADASAGELIAIVIATNATEAFDGYAVAYVVGPSLVLTPSSSYYSAGTSTSIAATVWGGSSVTGATIHWIAYGEWIDSDGEIANGTVANDSSFSVAASGTSPPLEIEVDAWATVDGATVASGNVLLVLDQGYEILLGVATPSSYSDGSYQPGQTISLSYDIVPTGNAPLPGVLALTLTAEGYPVSHSLQTTSASGSFSFTIPSNAVGGSLILILSTTGTQLSSTTCFNSAGCAGELALAINPHPSVLSYEIGAGSGLTVGWLILLVLVVVVGLALFLMLRRQRGPPAPASGTGMNPPAPAPTTPPPSEWKQPEAPPAEEPTSPPAAGEAPPPLPTPPEQSS